MYMHLQTVDIGFGAQHLTFSTVVTIEHRTFVALNMSRVLLNALRRKQCLLARKIDEKIIANNKI